MAYGAANVVLKGLSFVILLWIARSLSVQEYAQFGLMYALQSGIAMFAIAGIVESTIGLLNTHRDPDSRQLLFAAANAVHLMALGTTAVFAGVISVLLAPRFIDVWIALPSVLAAGGLASWVALQAEYQRIEERHKDALRLSFIVPLVGQLVGAVMFLLYTTAVAYFTGLIIGISLAMAWILLQGVGIYRVAHTLRDVKPLLRRSPPFIAMTLIGWLSGYGNNLVIVQLLEAEAVARFTFVLTLASMLQFVATSLNQVWAPRLFQLVQEATQATVESSNRTFGRWQAVLMGLAGALLVLLLPSLTGLVGGHALAYGDMRAELACICIAYVVFTPFWQCQNYFLAFGFGNAMMSVVLKTSVLGFVLWFGLTAWLGSMGIYVGFVLHLVLRMAGVLSVAKRYWTIQVAWGGVAIGILFIVATYSVAVGLAS